MSRCALVYCQQRGALHRLMGDNAHREVRADVGSTVCSGLKGIAQPMRASNSRGPHISRTRLPQYEALRCRLTTPHQITPSR
jgi:hypothetical protein